MGKENFEEFHKDHRAELKQVENEATKEHAKELAKEATPGVIEDFESLLAQKAEDGGEAQEIKNKLENLDAFEKALLDDDFVEQLKGSIKDVKKDTIQYKVLRNLERRAEHDEYHAVQVKAQKILDRFEEILGNNK